MAEKRFIIGLGTGRCGTVSLCNMLNQIPFSFFVHKGFMLPWNKDTKLAISKIKEFLNNTDKVYVGDIGFYWLPYVEDVINEYPNVKFICLKRDKDETIKSYLKKTEGRNHWMIHDGRAWKYDYIWDRCYPKYKAKTKEEAIALYWEEYYSRSSDLQLKYPRNFKIFSINVLNSSDNFSKVLNFLEVPLVKINPVRLNVLEKQAHATHEKPISKGIVTKIKTRWFVEKKLLPWRIEHLVEKRGGYLNFFLAPLRRLYFAQKLKNISTEYNIGVILPIRNVEPFRLYHALASIKWQEYKFGKIDCLVIDYGSTQEYITEYLALINYFGFKYIYINSKDDWSKSHALNIGIRNIGSTVIVICDVDLIFSPTFFQSAVKILKNDPCLVIYSFCIDLPEELNKHLYSLYLKKKNVELHYIRKMGVKRWAAQPSYGPLITYRYYLNLIGGYDEFFKIWGSEDDDLYYRLLRLGLDPKVLFDDHNFYCHIWHEKWGGLLTEKKLKKILLNKSYIKNVKTIRRNNGKMGYIVK